MKTKCPACGATTSLDALLGHSDASQAFKASLNLVGDLAKPLIKYLGLFRSVNRDLTFERTAKILDELAPAIASKQIKRNRQIYPAPTAAWIWAIGIMLERREIGKIDLPLKSHGYLYEVISSYKPDQQAAPTHTAKTAFAKTEAELAVDRAEHERLKRTKTAFSFAEMITKAQVEHNKQKLNDGETE